MLIKFNSVRLLGFNEKIIIPGINEVEAELVAAMMDDEIIAAKIEAGEIEILDSEDLGARKVKTKKGASEPSAVDILIASSDKMALSAVKSTVNIAILKEWLSKEKRVPVKKALREKIAKIENIEYHGETKKPKFEGSKKAFDDADFDDVDFKDDGEER